MPNLVVFEERAEAYRKALQPKFPEVTIRAATNEKQLAELVEEMDILLAFRIPDELIRRASRLRWIQSLATGVDYILNLPSLRKEILITSTRGMHGPQMSEMAFLLMLSLSRDLPRIVHNQDAGRWERWPAKLLYGKKVAILGVGVIGEEIARKCKAFGMTVYGIDVVRRQIEAVDYFLGPEDIQQAASETDYLVVVAPYTPQTYRIINGDVLSLMKPTAFLINIGRGELIDEKALIDALNAGKIAGAALDTFVQEPLPASHPFWKMGNVIITPHVGGMSDIYVEQASSIFEENLRRYLRGERTSLINLVTVEGAVDRLP
jgi:D-2-hydroxyacid dehydrogenase (NADP+)